ncbi:MAG: twin-arginine translocase TatA/TatE family subunit [Chloroflexi bacterium]|nr:twin-arginine translocase TatA/TatE family subunit [Chloroflexota bacterium]
MDFLGIGLPELLVVLLVALIIVGPKRLPEAAAQIARAIRTLRRYATEATSELRAEFEEATKDFEGVRGELREFSRSLDKEIRPLTEKVDETLRETRRAVPRQPIIETSATPAPDEPPPDADAS